MCYFPLQQIMTSFYKDVALLAVICYAFWLNNASRPGLTSDFSVIVSAKSKCVSGNPHFDISFSFVVSAKNLHPSQ
jgi:hypothetical protein